MPFTVTASSRRPFGSSVSSCERCQTASRTRCATDDSKRRRTRTGGVEPADQIPHEFASQASGSKSAGISYRSWVSVADWMRSTLYVRIAAAGSS